MTGSRVLVVDDNEINLQLVSFLLEAEGCDTHTARDAYAAVHAAEQFSFDLIVMDLYLPGMDGLELTRLFRAKAETAGVCIVAVTSLAMPGDEERAYNSGCDGYLTKPIDTRRFTAFLNNCLLSRQKKLGYLMGSIVT